MTNSVNQQVIDFTAVYVGTSPGEISDSTTLSSLGIISEDDIVKYLSELEDSFDLIFEEGDQIGIVTIGNTTAMIKKKLRGADPEEA